VRTFIGILALGLAVAIAVWFAAGESRSVARPGSESWTADGASPPKGPAADADEPGPRRVGGTNDGATGGAEPVAPEAAPPASATQAEPVATPESDPETLPDAQRREVERLTSRDATGLVPIEQPDGSVYIDLQGRFQHVPVARVNEDGTITIEER
jgi:hypothetical protein